MGLVSDVLQVFDLVSTGPTPATLANARLTLTWPDDAALGTGLAEGTVLSADGGLDRTTSPRPRVVAFLAPETTIRGLADAVSSVLHAIIAPSVPLPDTITIARAILAYHASDLGLTQAIAVGVPNRPADLASWEVGRGIRLPIELVGSGPVTDLIGWTNLAARADSTWDVLLDLPPQPLALPDTDADAAAATGLIVANPNLPDAASGLREQLLLNPSKAVFGVLAVLGAVDAASPTVATQAIALWTTLVDTTCSADELSLLAATLPGAIILRAIYRRLAGAAASVGHDPSVDAAIGALNAALGLPGTAAADLGTVTPTVVPSELPTSTAWQQRPVVTKPVRDGNGERTDGQHQLVLGRAYFAGLWTTEGKYTGPAYLGESQYRAGTYCAAHHDEVYGGADPTLTARLDVMAAISPNEGYLDAIRFRDKGIVSLGVQQWTVHVDDELNVVLWDLLTDHPDDFDAHFGIHVLRLDLTSTWPTGTPGVPDGRPRTVALARAVPGGANVPMTAPANPPVQPADRLTFFGGGEDPAHPKHYSFPRRPRGRVGCARPPAARARCASSS